MGGFTCTMSLVIGKYIHWEVQLHYRQNLLGRSIIRCNRLDAVDPVGLSASELAELWLLMSTLRQALVTLFCPDHFNYAIMGNTDPHVHVHLVPRYRSERWFEGVRFVDSNFGKRYSNAGPTDLPEETLLKLRDGLRHEMQKPVD